MPKIPVPTPATDTEVRALLDRYKCQVPFHAVRTRFLGNIATPVMEASPIKAVESLWGGQMPPFDRMEEVNELIGALIMGLWNRLSQHQERSHPFRLSRNVPAATSEGLAAVALMRREELDGFVEGLFGKEEELDFPERAHQALSDLAEMRSMFAAVVEVALDETKPGSASDLETTLRLIGRMTKDAEHEIHALVLACARARKQWLASMPVRKSTLH